MATVTGFPAGRSEKWLHEQDGSIPSLNPKRTQKGVVRIPAQIILVVSSKNPSVKPFKTMWNVGAAYLGSLGEEASKEKPVVEKPIQLGILLLFCIYIVTIQLHRCFLQYFM